MVTFKFKLQILPEYDIWTYNWKNMLKESKTKLILFKKNV